MAVVLYQLGILNFSSWSNGFHDFGQRKRRDNSVWTFKICQHLILSSMSSILIWDPWLHIAIYLELFATVYLCTSALVDFSQILKKNMCRGHSKYCISSKLGTQKNQLTLFLVYIYLPLIQQSFFLQRTEWVPIILMMSSLHTSCSICY